METARIERSSNFVGKLSQVATPETRGFQVRRDQRSRLLVSEVDGATLSLAFSDVFSETKRQRERKCHGRFMSFILSNPFISHPMRQTHRSRNASSGAKPPHSLHTISRWHWQRLSCDKKEALPGVSTGHIDRHTCGLFHPLFEAVDNLWGVRCLIFQKMDFGSFVALLSDVKSIPNAPSLNRLGNI